LSVWACGAGPSVASSVNETNERVNHRAVSIARRQQIILNLNCPRNVNPRAPSTTAECSTPSVTVSPWPRRFAVARRRARPAECPYVGFGPVRGHGATSRGNVSPLNPSATGSPLRSRRAPTFRLSHLTSSAAYASRDPLHVGCGCVLPETPALFSDVGRHRQLLNLETARPPPVAVSVRVDLHDHYVIRAMLTRSNAPSGFD
jgi:hypothetical protein